MAGLNKLQVYFKLLIKFNGNFKRSIKDMSLWSQVEMAPPDPILSLVEAFKSDTNPKKVNVAIGVYRGFDGEPFVLPTVRVAEKNILSRKLDKEYAPISGTPEFTKLAIELALGSNSENLKRKRYAIAQTAGGTGALCVGGKFLNSFWSGNKVIYIPNPSWLLHRIIFKASGLKVGTYRYYDLKNRTFAFERCLEDISKIPKKSIILLHGCAHNPTGMDPSVDQWCELKDVIKARKLLPFFDMAYQGFASGDMDKDAQVVRAFEKDLNILIAQSFSKNMGLYGERTGALSFVGCTKDEGAKILSQLKLFIRVMWSTPPIHGGRIATEILGNEYLRKMWLKDVEKMAFRLVRIRRKLKENLINLGSKKCWEHITNQKGMFCYSGLKPEEIMRLRKDFSVYLTKDGRISMAGASSRNVKYLAHAIHEVTK